VAAGQIEDVCKGLDSCSQHRNFDAVQGLLSDSEIVTWVAIPHSIIRSDLIVASLLKVPGQVKANEARAPMSQKQTCRRKQ
jgi:hypothetical protein